MDSEEKLCLQTTHNNQDDRCAKVRELNDALRCRSRDGKIFVTRGVTELGIGVLPEVMKAIAAFDDFTPANDPYGEHDYAAVLVGTHKVYWKIDYYDRAMQYGSPDPADPTVTTRVMTVFLASEY